MLLVDPMKQPDGKGKRSNQQLGNERSHGVPTPHIKKLPAENKLNEHSFRLPENSCDNRPVKQTDKEKLLFFLLIVEMLHFDHYNYL